MAELLYRKGEVEVLSFNLGDLSPKETNRVITRAGIVSHRSEERFKKTPEQFIQKLWEWGHLSVLEHSWFTFFIRFKLEANIRDLEKIELSLRRSNNLFVIDKEDDGIIVSGNARMFAEGYLRTLKENLIFSEMILGDIYYYLNKENPTLFPLDLIGGWIKKSESFYIKRIRSEDLDGYYWELNHQAMTVLFKGCSRGFTHEMVRARSGYNKVVAFTQESTRYVNYGKKGGIRFILPVSRQQGEEKRNFIFLIDRVLRVFSQSKMVKLMEAFYNVLTGKGFKPEEARQFLPIGIESQIAVTMNLRAWKRWFYLRTDKAAHPEMRLLSLELLKKSQKEYPNLFSDFQIKKLEEKIPYTVYTGDEDPMLL